MHLEQPVYFVFILSCVRLICNHPCCSQVRKAEGARLGGPCQAGQAQGAGPQWWELVLHQSRYVGIYVHFGFPLIIYLNIRDFFLISQVSWDVYIRAMLFNHLLLSEDAATPDGLLLHFTSLHGCIEDCRIQMLAVAISALWNYLSLEMSAETPTVIDAQLIFLSIGSYIFPTSRMIDILYKHTVVWRYTCCP